MFQALIILCGMYMSEMRCDAVSQKFEFYPQCVHYITVGHAELALKPEIQSYMRGRRGRLVASCAYDVDFKSLAVVDQLKIVLEIEARARHVEQFGSSPGVSNDSE